MVEAGESSFHPVLKTRNLLVLQFCQLRVLRGLRVRCHDLSRRMRHRARTTITTIRRSRRGGPRNWNGSAPSRTPDFLRVKKTCIFFGLHSSLVFPGISRILAVPLIAGRRFYRQRSTRCPPSGWLVRRQIAMRHEIRRAGAGYRCLVCKNDAAPRGKHEA